MKPRIHSSSSETTFLESRKSVTVVIGRNVTVLSGGQVTVHCPSSGLPAPVVTWSVEHRPLTFGESTFGNSTHIVIYDARVIDTGRYTCRARNIGGKVTASSYVKIMGE